MLTIPLVFRFIQVLHAVKNKVLHLKCRKPLKPGIRNVRCLQLHQSVVVVGILNALEASYGCRVYEPDMGEVEDLVSGLDMEICQNGCLRN